MKVHFLKTVWSDIIILEDNSRFALVDTGVKEQYSQLTEYLDKIGAGKIEFILLTHFHRDHYGNVCELVKNREVKKVYFKEYGGHDCTTAWGSEADDAYRQSEKENWQMMKECIEKYSNLEMVEAIDKIMFSDTLLEIYARENSVQTIWDDESHPETYHKNVFSENQNSLSVFFEVNNKTVFLGGDMLDCPSSHPLANYSTLQVAGKIGKQIYLYKAPHHGTKATTCDEALAIFKPVKAVITNGSEWLEQYNTIDCLKKANPDVEIILTEDKDVVFEL